MGLGHVGEQRGAEEVAALGQVAGGLVHLGAFSLAGSNQLGDLLQLGAAVDRADIGVLVERIAHPDRRQPVLEPVDERIGDRFLDQQARAGTAHLALVEVDPVDDPFDRLVERRVLEHDVGRLAAEFQGQCLVRSGHARRDLAADLGRAGERHLVDVRVTNQGHPDFAGPRDDVDDSRRQVRLAADIGEEEGRQRRRGSRLQNDRVPSRERRRDLPGQHEEREVPGDDLAGHTQGPGDATRKRVLELVRPARVVPEVGGGERHVDVAALLDRLAGIHRFEDGELAAALLEDPRDSVEVLGALLARQSTPASSEGTARGPHGSVHVRCGAARDLGQRQLGRGVHGGEIRAIGGGHLTAPDEQPVAVLELDQIARLGGRRVLPRDRLAVAQAPAGDRARRAGRRNRPIGSGLRGHAGIMSPGSAASAPAGWRAQVSGPPMRTTSPSWRPASNP